MKPYFLPVILALGFFATSCSTVQESGRRQLMLVPVAEETRMGLTAFEDVKSKEKISTDPQANARIQRIGTRIARAVGRDLPNAEWEFVVFDSDQLNAFALPGGKVGVYTGLMKLSQSDDELACVIGHEIAHVTSRHGGERVSQNMAAAGGAMLATIYMEAKDVDPAKRNMILAGYGLAATGAVLLPYSRAHESEADAIGLKFAATAGYDPRAAITFWQRMSAANADKPKPPEWMSTHPADTTRIANLQKLAPQYMAIYEAAKARAE